MTRAPRLSSRLRALEQAAQIAEERARICGNEEMRYPISSRAATVERAVKFEAELIARLIRERMDGRSKP